MAASESTAQRGVIVFARYDSRRLPGKALAMIGQRTLLSRVLDRARQVRAGTIVVATSDRDIDNPIALHSEGEGAKVFRGDCDDVARRALGCSQRFGFERFARVSGDSPFFDPEIVSDLFEHAEREDLDLATNVMPRTFPPGASAEIIATAALARIHAQTQDPADREHVTRFFYVNPDAYRIKNFPAPDARYAGVRLTVDNELDLARANWIAENLGSRAATASLDEVVDLARRFDAITGQRDNS